MDYNEFLMNDNFFAFSVIVIIISMRSFNNILTYKI